MHLSVSISQLIANHGFLSISISNYWLPQKKLDVEVHVQSKDVGYTQLFPPSKPAPETKRACTV